MSGALNDGEVPQTESVEEVKYKEIEVPKTERFEEGKPNSHQSNDAKDQRSIANRLAAEEVRIFGQYNISTYRN